MMSAKKCQPIWKKSFHHFVPVRCANMCTTFYAYRISSSEIRQEGSQNPLFPPPSSEEPLKSLVDIELKHGKLFMKLIT